MLRLFLLFTVLPVAELWLLIEVGGRIGGLETIGLCVLTAIAGASLARHQGAGVVRRMQESLRRGAIPAREMIDGVLILAAGLLLLTPGFITDAIGLLLLFPPTRAVVRVLFLGRLRRRLERSGGWRGAGPGVAGGPLGPDRAGPYRSGPDREIYRPEDAPRPPRVAPPPVIDVDPSP